MYVRACFTFVRAYVCLCVCMCVRARACFVVAADTCSVLVISKAA